MPKLAKIRRRRNGEDKPRRNPPLGTDLVEYIAPGFAAFAATRVLTRIVTVQITKRKPSWAKHAGAMAALSAFLASWWGAHRVKYLEKYHHPIVVGTGLATLQSLIQLYMPKIGQALDVQPQLAPGPTTKQLTPSSSQPLVTARMAPAAQQPTMPDGFKETDVNTWYSYNDSFDAGGYKGADKAPPPAPMVSTLAPDDDQIDDLLDNTDTGVFS